MFPQLFKIPLPHFLNHLLGNQLIVYTYGFCIGLGIILTYLYIMYQAKKELNTPRDTIINLVIYLTIAGIIGGKFFVYLENPAYYFGHISNALNNFKSGFVFYGSLIFAIPVMLWFFKKNKLPVLQMLDIMAIAGCIVHACGRMGCFFAGCCYGLPTHSIFGVRFIDVNCAAPLNIALHPTQLYEVFMILLIMIILLFFRKYKPFHGAVFFVYIMLYAMGRSIIEIFRGDSDRGFVIKNTLTNSQFISILLILSAAFIYYLLYRRMLRRKQNL